MKEMCDPNDQPFDCKRMACGDSRLSSIPERGHSRGFAHLRRGMLAEPPRTSTLPKRLPTLAEVADAMTGAIANLACGSLVRLGKEFP